MEFQGTAFLHIGQLDESKKLTQALLTHSRCTTQEFLTKKTRTDENTSRNAVAAACDSCSPAAVKYTLFWVNYWPDKAKSCTVYNFLKRNKVR